jgi:hypothetical protein
MIAVGERSNVWPASRCDQVNVISIVWYKQYSTPNVPLTHTAVLNPSSNAKE